METGTAIGIALLLLVVAFVIIGAWNSRKPSITPADLQDYHECEDCEIVTDLPVYPDEGEVPAYVRRVEVSYHVVRFTSGPPEKPRYLREAEEALERAGW